MDVTKCPVEPYGFGQTREFVDANELAARLKSSPRTIRSLARRRLIPFLRVGRVLRFDLHAVLNVMAGLQDRNDH